MIHKFTLCTALSLALACSGTKAEVVQASGDYIIGRGISQENACKLASDKAKALAIAKVVGETVSSEEQQICNVVPGNQAASKCEFNRVAWALSEGEIKILGEPKEEVLTQGNTRVCIVTFKAQVTVPSEKPDPNFQVGANTKQNVYRVGDDFSLEIESTSPAYIAVFNWLPHEGNKVNRIIKPDAKVGVESDFVGKNPSGKIGINYQLLATWSPAYSDVKRFYDEWLIVIATKKPQKWLSAYDFEDFLSQLREIPMDQRRVVRRPYQLAR